MELKIAPDSGALLGLVMIDVPPKVDRAIDIEGNFETGVPVLDTKMWPWKVTPDYSEPEKRDIDSTEDLACSSGDDSFVLWFSSVAAIKYLRCGDVAVGMSSDDELVCMVATRLSISTADMLHQVGQ
ncbi:hypothetical protein F0L68_11245 [Solihabitans fulvus]|uniref:Uncharacterized protein n=1 Tax=Solihabitans fulvus TaxID=1892852 RepID=A0A5B2XJK8_9PSEU|nr:hypothetical protein [Solihabitans fulvus]KAA2263020.1 hypothetical protein F0L68_11245 [Solihabitans fulvus]